MYEADDDEEWRLVISEVTAFMEVGMKNKMNLVSIDLDCKQFSFAGKSTGMNANTKRTNRGKRLVCTMFHVLSRGFCNKKKRLQGYLM